VTQLSRRERYFLSLLVPDGATIGVGTSVGESLRWRGLVTLARFGRLGITEAGREALHGRENVAASASNRSRAVGTSPIKGATSDRPKGAGNPPQTTPQNAQLPLF
jgi:hypothetical protein